MGLYVNTRHAEFFIPLMMAASGAAETFGFVINHGPQPNSPDIMNNSKAYVFVLSLIHI